MGEQRRAGPHRHGDQQRLERHDRAQADGKAGAQKGRHGRIFLQISSEHEGPRDRGALRCPQSTLPGLRIPFGSSMRLSPRISSSATGSFTFVSESRLSLPMPCSAEIEPLYLSTILLTASLISPQRARNCALSAPTGWLTLK